MIIFGSKGVSETTGRGTFFCPQCKADRKYWLKEVKRKGHVYFMPLVTLGSVGSYVECATCSAQFDQQVLELPTTAKLEQLFDIAIRSAIGAMIRADDEISAVETELGASIVSRFLGKPVSAEELGADLTQMDAADGLDEALAAIRLRLSEEGKVQILQSCILMALADGQLHRSELTKITEIAEHLESPDRMCKASSLPLSLRLLIGRTADVTERPLRPAIKGSQLDSASPQPRRRGTTAKTSRSWPVRTSGAA